MAEPTIRLDEEIRDNLALAARVSCCLVLAGLRQFDRFVIESADKTPRVLSLERLVHESVGATATWHYDPAATGQQGQVSLVRAAEAVNLDTALPQQRGTAKELSLIQTLDAWTGLQAGDNDEPGYALIVDASLLFEDASAPHDDEFKLLRLLEKHARRVEHTHTLVLRVNQSTALPQALSMAPQVRTIHIPPASRDVRYSYTSLRGGDYARQCGLAIGTLAETLSKVTEDWTLDQLDALVNTAEHQDFASLQDMEELARAVRIGTTYSPWAGARIHDAVARAGEEITRRVQGQSQAVEAVATALRKSVVGLSSAHQSGDAQTPRAVFFFAGPTGTGKTELAKAISQLVFGQEQLLRFDCGELQQEHAIARLIGAPPGYVGHDQGGELTEGIRSKPNSVVLFDEIEKAHPRLLDTLLGVLDDGRLTSGRGETALFGQAVIIFTSNLGMYEETVAGNGLPTRRARFDYDTPFEDIQQSMRAAIREEFVSKLGRPEMLGRLGGAESIVVFDFLRNLEDVCHKFIQKIRDDCKNKREIELEVDEAVVTEIVQRTRERPDSLMLGGRGLIPELDSRLKNPLSDYVFHHQLKDVRIRATLDNGRTVFATQ